VRTTLTLDPDVARLVDEAASRLEPYRLPVHEAALQPGLDLTGFNRLADELEDEAILADRNHRKS
jgi:hypothetical protein